MGNLKWLKGLHFSACASNFRKATVKQQLLLAIYSLPERERQQLVDELLQVIDAYLSEQARQRESGRKKEPPSERFSEN